MESFELLKRENKYQSQITKILILKSFNVTLLRDTMYRVHRGRFCQIVSVGISFTF